jgi:protein involved in polysaccharide export with SLBB domain
MVTVLVVCLALQAATQPAEEARITPGMVLEIEIDDLIAPGVTRTVHQRVSDKGEITLPLAGTLGVGGRTAAAARAEIARIYGPQCFPGPDPIRIRILTEAEFRRLAATTQPAQ